MNLDRRDEDRVADRLAILDLWARYCLTLDQGDIDGYVELFTADTVYEVYGRRFGGHDGVRTMVSGAPEGLHLGGPAVIEFTAPDTASTVTNLYFVPIEGSPRGAVYHGEVRRTASGWRISRWRCQFVTADGLQDRP